MRTVLASVILLAAAGAPLAGQTCTVPNDVNGDGVFDFKDPKALLVYLFVDPARPACLSQADANGDGRVDIADAVTMTSTLTCAAATLGDADGSGTVDTDDVQYILAYLFQGGPEPIPCVDVADWNGSGSVNIADAAALSTYLCDQAIPGDANADGQVDIADLIVVAEYLYGGGPPPVPCVAAGDINEDGNVDIGDFIAYLGLF